MTALTELLSIVQGLDEDGPNYREVRRMKRLSRTVEQEKTAVLRDLLEPEALERARKLVEDELIDWRDSGLFTLRNNGLSVRNKDGSGSEIIRFGFEAGLQLVIKDRIETLAGEASE